MLSKSDFIQGLENLKIKLASKDINLVFDYLDLSRDGVLSYAEFCNLCEEKRRNIDPFSFQETKRKQLNQTMQATSNI